MPRRGNQSMGGFGNAGNKKPNISMNNNRNRPSLGGKSTFGGSGVVSPWLSQNNSSNSFTDLERSIASDQQAQLALAGSLLNNLLNPVSQLNKLPTPPSLLSLGRTIPNSSPSFGGSLGFNRDRIGFGRSNSGKVQKDFRKGNTNNFKNKRFGDRKNNKKSNQAFKKPIDEIANAEKKDVLKKEEVKIDNTDVDQFSSEKSTIKIPANECAKKETEGEKKEEKKEEIEKSKEIEEYVETSTLTPVEPKASYKDIPPALLFCHICRKHMWDDVSFEKHLEGRPHKMMIEELDHSYKLKVDLLRHEMRVAEQQRENDIQRAQRKGKNNMKMQQRDFCTMCNLSFLGMLPAHRKNERHQRLKKFLHPKCNTCSKEFYTRLEWDDHKLMPAHLKKLAELRKEIRPDLENTEFDVIDFIEDINDEYDTDTIELKVVGKRESLNDLQKEKHNGSVENSVEENDLNETNDEKAEEEEAKKLPKYNPGTPVGENFIVDKTGFLCRACNRFILSAEDIRTHCQTVVHYNNIIKILKAQNKIVRKRRLNDTKGDDEEKSEEKSEKRQKVNDQSDEVKKIVNTDVEPESEKYDPENPSSESEKVVGSIEFKRLEQDPTDVKIELNLQPNIIITDIKNEEVDIKEPIIFEPPKEEKRVRSSPLRGPRARRGRRH